MRHSRRIVAALMRFGPKSELVVAAGRLRRVALRLAPIALLFIPLALLEPATRARAQPPWVLDQYEVIYTEDIHGEVETGRHLSPGGTAPIFQWGGTAFFTDTVPSNRLIATATFEIDLPSTIVPGRSFKIGGKAKGTISTPGRQGPSAGSMGIYSDCYLPEVCRGGLRGQYIPEIAGKNVDFTLEITPVTAALPTDETLWPSGPLLIFRGGIGTTRPGDPYWRIKIYAYYKRPDNSPTPVPTYRLELGADATRLPPSGATQSTADIEATVTDGAGRPVSGESVAFSLEPADMGRLQMATGQTNAEGIARVKYTAPALAELRGRKLVTVRARVPTRQLERTLGLEIESYRLSAVFTPTELPVRDPPASAKLRLVAERFDGRPAAGDKIKLRLDPPDMGQLLGEALAGDVATVDAQGVAELIYDAPTIATMNNRDQVTVFATNLSHGGEASAALRFAGLKVTSTQPGEGARDVDLKPASGADLRFDRAIDPKTVTPETVKVQTLWHGDLAATAQAVGNLIQVRITQDPIPDVGLVVTVWLKGGNEGIKSIEGRGMAGDFSLRFETMPLLKPKIIVSQVVDDPRDPNYGLITVSPKPFLLRIAGGLSGDSELEKELAMVTLKTPSGGEEVRDHRFYPGDWSPRVPPDVVRHGNTANFFVDAGTRAGGFAVTANVRPYFAPLDKARDAEPVTVNITRWRSGRLSTGMGILFVPIINDHLPGYEWNVSRNQLVQWATQLGSDAPRYLPLRSLAPRMGYFDDTTCGDPDECKFATNPWTDFNYWIRHIGRTGFATPWSYIFAVVPQGWFAKRFTENSAVSSYPELYHNMINNGIWTDATISRNLTRRAPSQSALLEATIPGSALVHALGDVIGIPHTASAGEPLAGYDLANDQAIVTNAEGSTGADYSLMSENVGFGSEWITRSAYEAFLDRWAEKACEGVPPCAPSLSVRADPSLVGPTIRDDSDAAAESPQIEPDPIPLIGVSGTIRQGATESATIEPLIWFDGQPTLTAGDSGDYAIVLSDAAGQTLGRYAFTPTFGPISGGQLASYLVSVPRPANATLARVALVHGSTDIGGAQKSANFPTIRITRPTTGQSTRGAVEAAWSGQDADGDTLTYTLLFSGDGGEVWLPLQVDARVANFTLPGDDLPNGRDSRLRVVASDGFNSSTAEVSFSLNGGQRALATVPEDGARGVSPLTGVRIVLRDPLDPVSLTASTMRLRGPSGQYVAGNVSYNAESGAAVFQPLGPLLEAQTYEARLTTGATTTDGRALAADYVWHFTTRGQTVYLPRLSQSGSSAPVITVPTLTPRPTRPTPRPTQTPYTPPTRPATTPFPTARPSSTSLPAATPTSTSMPTVVAPTSPPTVPTPVPPTSPPPTVPTPVPPTSPPSPTAAPQGVTAVGALTTGSNTQLTRQAFAAGEPILLFIGTTNGTGATVNVQFEFTVVGDNGYAPGELAWRGALDVPAGAYWFRLERTVPATMPSGPYRFLGTVTYNGKATTVTSDFVVADSLQRFDDFSNPSSGWTTGNDANAHSGYLDGAFQLLVHTAGFWRFDTTNLTAGNLAMEADVRFVGEAQGAAGLVSGISADGQSWLNFVVVRDGRFGLYRRNAGVWEPVLAFAPSAAIDRTANHLMVARRGTEVRLYANGQQLAVTDDSRQTSGGVGLYAEATTPELDARFDEFRLYRLR